MAGDEVGRRRVAALDGLEQPDVVGHVRRPRVVRVVAQEHPRLRRERVAQVQRGARENGMRYDSAYADLAVRDAEIAAHAAFRRKLYDHDVVPEAQAAAMALA